MAHFWVFITLCFPLGYSNRINHAGPLSGFSASAGNASYTVFFGGLFPIHKERASGLQRCGEIESFGFEMAMAMVYAVETINQNQEILPNISLAFAIHDTCSHANTALEESLSFLAEQCKSNSTRANRTVKYFSGIVGAALSSVSVPVASLLRLFKLPQISPSSTAVSLSNKEQFNFFFRTVPSDSGQVQVIYDIVKLFNWTYVSIIYTADVYGESGFKGLQRVFEEDNSSNICIANIIPLSPTEDPLAYEDAVDKLMKNYRKNATVVILFAQKQTAQGVTKVWQQRNSDTLEHEITWIVSDGAATDVPWARGMLGVYPTSRPSEEFNMWFKQIGGSNTAGSPWVSEYIDSIVGCVQYPNGTSQGDCTNENVTIGDLKLEPNFYVSPTVDAVYAFAYALHNMSAEECNYTLCDAILATSSGKIKGDLFREYLRSVNFPGVSQDVVAFNAKQDLNSGGYIIINLQLNTANASNISFDYKEVGNWSNGKLSLRVDDICWNTVDGQPPSSICSKPCAFGYFEKSVPGEAQCCWTCEQCGPEQASDGKTCMTCPPGEKPDQLRQSCKRLQLETLDWAHPLAAILLIVSLLGAVTTTVFMGIFAFFRKTRVIKATSRELSAVILGGIFLCYLLPLIYIGTPHAVSCAFRRYGIGVCLSLCFGALLVKLSRIHRIFNQKKLTTKLPHFIDWKSQLVFTAIIVLLQLLIGTVWLIAEHPGVTERIDNTFIELRCQANSYYGLSVSLAYNFLLLFGCIYLAIRTRKVPADYNETRFIHITVFSMCVIWLAFLPVYYSTTTLHPVIYISSQIVAIFMTATCLVVFLIVPKLYLLFVKKEREEYTTTQYGNTVGASLCTKQNCPCACHAGRVTGRAVLASPVHASFSCSFNINIIHG